MGTSPDVEAAKQVSDVGHFHAHLRGTDEVTVGPANRASYREKVGVDRASLEGTANVGLCLPPATP